MRTFRPIATTRCFRGSDAARVVLVAQLLIAIGPGLATAEERADFIALSLGRGSADFSIDTVVGNVDTGWVSGGTSLHLSLGREVLPNLVLEVGYGVWRRPTEVAESEESDPDNVDRYLGAGSLVANLYPEVLRLDGLALRAGLGVGKGYVKSPAGNVEEWGALALVGLGYEIAVEGDFSVGARVDTGFFGGRPALGGKVLFGSVFAKLSFPSHF